MLLMALFPHPLSRPISSLLNDDQVLAKFLAPPGRLADLLSIAGDKSDGVVGAEGYGPVKAAKV